MSKYINVREETTIPYSNILNNRHRLPLQEGDLTVLPSLSMARLRSSSPKKRGGEGENTAETWQTQHNQLIKADIPGTKTHCCHVYPDERGQVGHLTCVVSSSKLKV